MFKKHLSLNFCVYKNYFILNYLLIDFSFIILTKLIKKTI